MSFCGTNRTEPISFAFQGAKWRQFTLTLRVVLPSLVKGSFIWGIIFLVVRVDSDSGDDIISISDDENNPVSDQNVSSTVPNTGTGGGDNVSVPKESVNITMTSGVEGSEPPISKDSSSETEVKPIILPKLENNHREPSDKPPKIEKDPEEASEGMIEEILPIPPNIGSLMKKQQGCPSWPRGLRIMSLLVLKILIQTSFMQRT